ncbi:MAG TPA: electron transfer flavoprotein subunit alpha/FixB family protein [Nocardioides sp.]|jgi:electron transfer flavoprotein alpha subunit|nr:electron transfer flavoprotein subunit alpha/FixB family protein [Nocardioides sp.]
MILLWLECDANGVTEISLETVAFARSLSAAGGGIAIRAALFGDVPEAARDQLAAHGVDEVHHVTGAAYDAYAGAAWASALQDIRERTKCVVVAAAGSPRGNEVIAHLAARLDVPMAANVLAFSGLSPFEVTRQVAGGAALEDMQLPQRPALFTVAGHSWTATPADQVTSPAWHEESPAVAEADLVARVSARGEAKLDDSGALTSARVVVGAGRGAGGPDGFDGVIELAKLLDGALGVSRVVTSLGWRPHNEQVGQTGSRISPELYIPCGISGAIQHWAGCSSSKTILAINTDAEAPMVTKAHYAVIGDMHEVVPAIVEELNRRAG